MLLVVRMHPKFIATNLKGINALKSPVGPIVLPLKLMMTAHLNNKYVVLFLMVCLLVLIGKMAFVLKLFVCPLYYRREY